MRLGRDGGGFEDAETGSKCRRQRAELDAAIRRFVDPSLDVRIAVLIESCIYFFFAINGLGVGGALLRRWNDIAPVASVRLRVRLRSDFGPGT